MKIQTYGSWSESSLTETSGFEGKRNEAYLCEAGRWTIGYGHTQNVCPGDVCTDEQAMDWLNEDVKETVSGLARYVNVPVSR